VVIAASMLFAVSAALCIKAVRWDRWAEYEATHPRWHERGIFGMERYSGFKAWQFRRACWTRGLAATVISAASVLALLVVALITRPGDGFGWRWLVLLGLIAVLHAIPLVYFVMRWGPDFGHPPASWGG
jgi:hypothetical protein